MTASQLMSRTRAWPAAPISARRADAPDGLDQTYLVSGGSEAMEAALGEVGVHCGVTEAVHLYRLGPGFTWASDFADDLRHGKFGRTDTR